jgi:Tfx family DNA-binding protein
MTNGSSNQSQEPEEVHKPEENLGPLLTKRQFKVLQLRRQGLSQAEVAMKLGTTRSNISILEKRAYQNIQRAERTIHQWMMIQAPISLSLKAGTDVFDLPKMIFEAADKISMRLPVTSLDIVVQLRRKAPRIFKKRSLEQDAEIYVTEEGDILVEAAEKK